MRSPSAVVVLLALAFSACSRGERVETTPATTDTRGLRIFHCSEGHVVLVRPIPRGLAIAWADRQVAAMRISGLSDEVYVGGGFTFEQHGDEATLDVGGGEAVMQCERREAARRLEGFAAQGVVVYAVGSEPFWWLTATDARFVLDQVGAERRDEGDLARTEHRREGDVYLGRFDAIGRAPLRIEVYRRLCYDGMSGAPFPAEVRVRLDDVELTGCGVFLSE